MTIQNPWTQSNHVPQTVAAPELHTDVRRNNWRAGLIATHSAGGLAAWKPATYEPLWAVGAHGGAGTTSLAKSLHLGDSGTRWPLNDTQQTNVVVVARNHFAGLRAAQRAAIQWASGAFPTVSLHGLVLVPDLPGKQTKDLIDLEKLISGAFPAVWKTDFVSEWRIGDAWKQPLPRSYKKLDTALSSVISKEKP